MCLKRMSESALKTSSTCLSAPRMCRLGSELSLFKLTTIQRPSIPLLLSRPETKNTQVARASASIRCRSTFCRMRRLLERLLSLISWSKTRERSSVRLIAHPFSPLRPRSESWKAWIWKIRVVIRSWRTCYQGTAEALAPVRSFKNSPTGPEL